MALEKYQEVRDTPVVFPHMYCKQLDNNNSSHGGTLRSSISRAVMSESTLMVIFYLLLDPRLLTFDLSLSVPQACENGRGAILLSVARGKVSEGIDFGK